MKTSLLFVLAALVATASVVRAQDPGFRDAEVRRAPATTQPTPVLSDDSSQSAAKINSMEVLDDSRPLQMGDRISLRIVEDRDRVQSLIIQDSGDIQAPHMGLVKAAGKTCKQVAYYMKKELEKHYFQQATVIIALEAVRPPKSPSGYPGTNMPIGDFFVVYGQVARQGKYELSPEEELTVSQAILRAGGFSQFANTKNVRLIRRTPQGNKSVRLNLDDVMRKGRLEKDILMRRNDVIIIDEKLVNF